MAFSESRRRHYRSAAPECPRPKMVRRGKIRRHRLRRLISSSRQLAHLSNVGHITSCRLPLRHLPLVILQKTHYQMCRVLNFKSHNHNTLSDTCTNECLFKRYFIEVIVRYHCTLKFKCRFCSLQYIFIALLVFIFSVAVLIQTRMNAKRSVAYSLNLIFRNLR